LTGRAAHANASIMAEPADMEELSFEEALQRLEAIVQQLERGDVPLDRSITLYAEGDKLRAQCQKRLEAAQARIEQIVGGADGAPSKTTPFPAG
jgi:exodeoxyribonuclease VII small subunit